MLRFRDFIRLNEAELNEISKKTLGSYVKKAKSELKSLEYAQQSPKAEFARQKRVGAALDWADEQAKKHPNPRLLTRLKKTWDQGNAEYETQGKKINNRDTGIRNAKDRLSGKYGTQGVDEGGSHRGGYRKYKDVPHKHVVKTRGYYWWPEEK